MTPPVLYNASGERLTDAEFRAMVALHGGEALTQALLHLRAVVNEAEQHVGIGSGISLRLITELRRARLFLAQHREPTP